MIVNNNTINADVTMGGSEGTLLANRYRVVRQLGQGGMGSVWLADDTQLDNRQVAIKMLPSVFVSNKRAYQQLKAEALVSLKLTHPNIATVRAFEEENGNPFLVMDYIDGITLDDYLLEKSCLPESEVIRLLTPIAAALDYAHSKGVIHRDVKPGNVMISTDGTPYILDFGIAREIQETMTRVTGKLSSGTLMYMSPEQLNGDAPSAAQDIYSFAAMAYECLTGAPPFSRGNIEYQIMSKDPSPLAPHFMKCGAGVMAGLAKQPTKRPIRCSLVLKDSSVASARCEELSGLSFSDSASDSEYDRTQIEIRKYEAILLQRDADKCAMLEAQKRETELAEAKKRLKELRRQIDGEAASAGEIREVALPGCVKMTLVWCPPGEFTMGSPVSEEGRFDDEEQRRVTFTKGFWIGRYPVTQEQWESVMGLEPKLLGFIGGGHKSFFVGSHRPMENVSWHECQEFCRKAGLGLRLPTEAEWEYACRAGTTSAFAGTGRLDDMGWYDGNSNSQTHDVGQKKPNGWGIYDMHGNVWEWCSDCYCINGAATDSLSLSSGERRVSRGGGWSGIALGCRSANRFGNVSGHCYNFLGFRVCCSAGQSEWEPDQGE